MSKTLTAGMTTMVESDATTLAWCIEITRTDGQVFRWTSHVEDIPVDGETFLAEPNFDVSSIASTAGFEVDNLKLTVLADEDITRADLLAGVWDGADFEIFQTDHKDPTNGKIDWKAGRLGVFQHKRNCSEVELRDLRQAIQAPHDAVVQPTCRYQLGVRNAVSHCPVDLAGYTVTGTLTGVTSQYVVTDTGRSEDDGWFDGGSFRFTSGLNADLPARKIKSFVGGVFTFWDQFIQPISDVDDYEAVAGCLKRFYEDCIAKFGVGVDFGGEPNKRNPDSLSAPAGTFVTTPAPSPAPAPAPSPPASPLAMLDYPPPDTFISSGCSVASETDPLGSGETTYQHEIFSSVYPTLIEKRAEYLWQPKIMTPGHHFWMAVRISMDSAYPVPIGISGYDTMLVFQSHTDAQGDTQPPYALFLSGRDNEMYWRTSWNSRPPADWNWNGGAYPDYEGTSGHLGSEALMEADVGYCFIIHYAPGYTTGQNPLFEVWRAKGAADYVRTVSHTGLNTYNVTGFGSGTYPRDGLYKWNSSAWHAARLRFHLSPQFWGEGADLYDEAVAALAPYKV